MGTDLETIFDLGCNNNAENKNDEILRAKELLIKNGYIVKKLTHAMELDAKECEEMDFRGESKDCCGCSCSVCLMQWIRNFKEEKYKCMVKNIKN